jgi:hypothetical protein
MCGAADIGGSGVAPPRKKEANLSLILNPNALLLKNMESYIFELGPHITLGVPMAVTPTHP